MTELKLNLVMPLIGVIVGALIAASTTFLAGYFTDKRKRRMDVLRLKLEKLEEAKYALHEIFDSCVHLTTTSLMKTLWNNDLETRKPEFTQALAKASTLISLYFPEVRTKHQVFVDSKGELASVVVEIYRIYLDEPGFDKLTREQKHKAAEMVASKADALLGAVRTLEGELEQIASNLTRI